MKRPLLMRLRIRNFKAIRESGSVKLSPLTVLIGNNGSGKSSVIEALDTLRTLVVQDVDAAMQMWKGIEHVRNKTKTRQTRHSRTGSDKSSKPIAFSLVGNTGRVPFATTTVLNERGNENELFIEREFGRFGAVRFDRHEDQIKVSGDPQRKDRFMTSAASLLSSYLGDYVESWQFLNLSPHLMGNPVPQTRTRRGIRLDRSGANLSEYLLDIRRRDLAAFDGIVGTLKYVLPYASDIQPTSTSEIERAAYLQLSERDFKVPGWLISAGTLRILALLAVLRHPSPPSLIIVEEIENGLDPRSMRLLVDEIQRTVESGRSQVILTTHSPSLLDSIPLKSIVFVERVDDEPTFVRPGDEKEVQKWAKSFSPGQLYTMNRLSRKRES
ncbi:MAG: ATP-binding protein [Candidatus Acidiferrum sp.]